MRMFLLLFLLEMLQKYKPLPRAVLLTLLLKPAKPLSKLSSCCISPLQIPISRFLSPYMFVSEVLRYSAANFIGDRHLCRKGKLPLYEISDFAVFPGLRFFKSGSSTAGRTIQADVIACIEVRS